MAGGKVPGDLGPHPRAAPATGCSQPRRLGSCLPQGVPALTSVGQLLPAPQGPAPV